MERLEKVFAKAQEYGVTISERKVKWGQEIKFGGFMTKSGEHGPEVSPDPDLLAGIRHFLTTKNISELRGFIGLTNQIAQWNPNLSVGLRTCRLLLK